MTTAPVAGIAANRAGSCRRSPASATAAGHAPSSAPSTCPALAAWTDASAAGHRARQDRTRRGGRLARRRDEHQRTEGRGRGSPAGSPGRPRRRSHRPPAHRRSRVPTLSGCPSIRVARPMRSRSPTTTPVSARPSTSPATIADDDEPSPRSSGTVLRAAERHVGNGDVVVLAEGHERAPGQVVVPVRDLARALTLAPDPLVLRRLGAASVTCRLRRKRPVPRRREPERIEPRSEVGGRRGDADGVVDESRGGAHLFSPSAAAAASTSAAMVTGCDAPLMAHSGSFRP